MKKEDVKNVETVETVAEENEVVEVMETIEEEVPEAVVKAEDETYDVAENLDDEEEKTYKSKNIELNFGIKSNDLLELEEEAIKEKNFKELQKHKRNNSLLWVRLDGVELDTKHNVALAVTRWNDMRIVIPDTKYFMPTYDFGDDYAKMNAKEKARARYRAMSFQIGAVIGIMVDQLNSELTNDGKVSYGIVGDRVRAMNLLQFYYFTRTNLADNEMIHVGDVVKAKVLAVHPLYALVECLGVETRIDTFNISNEHYRDCREAVAVGDEIIVRIRKLHLPENLNEKDAQVYLTVSARVKAVKNIREAIKQNCIYQGTVTKYNSSKNIYTITLTDGINVSCHKQNNAYDVYRVGDKVAVMISFITDDYAAGHIVKKISVR